MALEIVEQNEGRVRVISDTENPHIYWREYRCKECGEWIGEEDVIWTTPSGDKTSVIWGYPYHTRCAPEEENYA